MRINFFTSAVSRLLLLLTVLDVDSCLYENFVLLLHKSLHNRIPSFASFKLQGTEISAPTFLCPGYLLHCMSIWLEGSGSTSPLGFLANLQLSTGLICIYRPPFEPDWPCLLT